MTTNQPNTPNNFETTVLSELRQINQRLDHLESNLEKVEYKFDTRPLAKVSIK